MNLQSLNTLEYEIIKTELSRHAVSYVGKKTVEELMPMTYLPSIQRAMEETSEAKELLERGPVYRFLHWRGLSGSCH